MMSIAVALLTRPDARLIVYCHFNRLLPPGFLIALTVASMGGLMGCFLVLCE